MLKICDKGERWNWGIKKEEEKKKMLSKGDKEKRPRWEAEE